MRVPGLGSPFHLVSQNADALYLQFNDVSRFDPLVKLHAAAKAYGSGTNKLSGVEGIVFDT